MKLSKSDAEFLRTVDPKNRDLAEYDRTQKRQAEIRQQYQNSIRNATHSGSGISFGSIFKFLVILTIVGYILESIMK